MIGGKVAMLHAIAGTLIPLLVVAVMTRFFGPRNARTDGLADLEIRFVRSLCDDDPLRGRSPHVLGPEFPSLIGSLVGLAIVVPAARDGFLLPTGEPWDFEPRRSWDESWNGIDRNATGRTSHARLSLLESLACPT